MYVIDNISFRKSIGGAGALETLEAQVVQDADRLDALGALGVARLFTYGGVRGQVMHDPDLKPRGYRNEEEYAKRDGSTINHACEKLLKLKDMMNTEAGRKIAEERHEYLANYLEVFLAEWDGER